MEATAPALALAQSRGRTPALEEAHTRGVWIVSEAQGEAADGSISHYHFRTDVHGMLVLGFTGTAAAVSASVLIAASLFFTQ